MEYIDIKYSYKIIDVENVVDGLKNGDIVIIPTDTVYGIACDAINQNAVRKIYKLKHRKINNPMNILVSDIDMIRKVVKNVSETEEKLIKEFLPGAMTIVFEKNEIIPDCVTAGLNTLGIRIPKNKFLLDVIKKLGRPIVATSCNIAGEKEMIFPNEILEKFKSKVRNYCRWWYT